MKQKIFIIAFLLTAFSIASAKTTMTLTTGEEIEVIIETVGISDIAYKKASNPSGPSYTTARANVFFIIYDDGSKEVITPMTQSTVTSDTGRQSLANAAVGMTNSYAAPADTLPARNYFPRTTIFPRANIGYQATMSGMDNIDIEWGGLGWSVDLNVLFPSSNTSAWSIGLGLAGLEGNMTARYSNNSGNHKQDMGDLSAMYLTIPIEYYWQCGEWFMFGMGDRIDILVSQRSGGKKVKDACSGFRDAFFLDGVVTLGHFNAGARILFNLANAFMGKDMSWSPTIGLDFTIGYYF